MSNPDDLYFITCAGFVKIGRAKDVWKRMQNMQSNTPFEIGCIARLQGRGYEEPAWHEAFAEDKKRGEWFNPTPELKKAIEAARNDESWWDETVPTTEFLCDNDVNLADNADYWFAVESWQIKLGLMVEELRDRKPKWMIDAEALLAAHRPKAVVHCQEMVGE